MKNIENNVVANYNLESAKLQTSHNGRKLRTTGVCNKKLMDGVLNNSLEKILIENFSKGVYLMIIYGKSETYTFKIIKL